MSAPSSLPDPGLFPLPELAVARHPAVILAPRQLKRWVGELPLANPPRAASMLLQQLRLLVHDPQPGARLITLLELYTAPVAQLLATAREQQHKDAEHALPPDPLEQQLVEILTTLGDGYLRALNETLLVDRAPPLRDLFTATWAFEQALSIERLHYRPTRPAIWQRLTQLFLCAERHGIGDRPLAADERRDDDPDTVRGIFYRALVIGLSDPCHRRPGELLAWSAWITRHAQTLELGASPSGQHPIPFDLSGHMPPPAGVRRDQPGAQIRYLLADEFLQLAAGQAPGLRDALLALADGRRSPELRRSPRRSSTRPYRILPGLRNVYQRLSELAGGHPAGSAPAAWQARQLDQSKRGAAFLLPNTVKPPLTIGAPILAEVAGNDPGGAPLGFVAVIRRVVAVDTHQFEIGVEKLPGRLVPVKIANVSGGRSYADPFGLLLHPADGAGLVLLAPRTWYHADDQIAVAGPTTRYRLRMNGLLAATPNVAQIAVEPVID